MYSTLPDIHHSLTLRRQILSDMEVAEWVKGLLHEPETLSSTPSTHIKARHFDIYLYPQHSCVDTGRSGDPLAS